MTDGLKYNRNFVIKINEQVTVGNFINMSRYSFLQNRDRIIFVDTETTGIPIDSTASYKNIDNWPNILQIAWLVYKKDGTLESSHNYATPNNASTAPSVPGYIPRTIQPIHQILDQFLNSLSSCNVIIGHNIEYDVHVILCELYRYGKDTSILESMQQFCTMKNSVEICGFDTSRGDRYPKLQELYSKLFHQPFDNAHDAYCDIKATADCFWKIFNDRLLDLNDYPFLIDAQKKAQIAKDYQQQAEKALTDSKSGGWKKSIYSEACETLGISSLFSSDKDNEKVLNYICTKYHIKAKDNVALAKLLEDDKKTREESKKHSYDKPLRLFQKAAELGDSHSMFRIGHLYYYDLDDKSNAISWYIKAIEHGYVSQDCYYEYASLSTRLYGSKSSDGPKYYNKWAQLCEDGFETISRRHLDLYIEAFEKGRYGQTKNLQKAIELCQRALSLNRPDFGRTDTRYGIRHTLADLLEQTGDYRGAVEQQEIYLRELYETKKYSLDCFMLEEKLLKIYFEGIGIPVDYIKAKSYIEVLVSEGKNSSIGFFYLGQCYETGIAGYPKDSYKAFQCFKKAEETVPEALRKIGIMYLDGIGCEKSKKQAREYLTKAKNKGMDVSPYLERARSWF